MGSLFIYIYPVLRHHVLLLFNVLKLVIFACFHVEKMLFVITWKIMRKISSPSLSQLLRQLKFTPQEKRRKQLDAAEELFGIIDKDREYPFEFICFRITGFQLKSAIGS